MGQQASATWFVEVMSARQKRHYRLLVAAWLLTQMLFWSWWFQDEHVVTAFGMFINSVLLVWTTLLPAWYLFFLGRIRQPNPGLPLPDGRVAMVVTRAPSEPWPVVRNTLEAMLAQDFPRPYDVWLADEDPSPDIWAWCASRGVQVSCRKGVAGYNNPSWPRREKCKEGNLTYFYEVMDGYGRYDFVAQLDADHVPDRAYLAEMIRPFSNQDIGYVAAPSVCNANARRSWAARARLYAEAAWHGSVQAGSNEGYAPQCIGSHYAVRTAALRAIGGLGPELAEDFSTTLSMNAHGWQGAFALQAVARGDGPASVADCITQEFQWSRSLARIFVSLWPSQSPGLPLRLRVKLGFCLVWYFLFTIHALLACLVPIVALATRTPWVDINIAEFLVRASAPSAVALLTLAWVRKHGWLRPLDAPILSWEALLFEFVRWPWNLLGVGHAIVGHVTRREYAFRVTPKGISGPRPLPSAVLAPYVAIVVAHTSTALLVADPGQAGGYYYLALLTALTYALVIGAIVTLQVRENVRSYTLPVRGAIRGFLRASPVPLLASLTASAALLVRGGAALTAFTPEPAWTTNGAYNGAARTVLLQAAESPSAFQPAVLGFEPPVLLRMPEPTPAGPPAPPRLPLPQAMDLDAPGVSVGAYDPDLALADLPLQIEHWYVRQDDPDLLRGSLAHARNRRTVLTTIEPWPSSRLRAPVLDNIAAGQADGQLRRLAEVVRASQPQVALIRWGHEMELSGLYPWAANDPELYVQAYRHVVEVFSEAGATNVRWVWSPAGNPNALAYYPGNDVVDYIGLTVLGDEGWDAQFDLPPQSFEQIFEPRYQRLSQLGKPIIVAEAGVSGSAERQSAWLAAAGECLADYPLLRAVVYFDALNPAINALATRPDWRVPPGALGELTGQV